MKRKRNDERESDLPANLSQPALRALAGAGYSRLEQLTDVSEADLKRLHGMGPKALEQLRRALSARGLSFADEKGGGNSKLRTANGEPRGTP
jgi:DNA-directed RNA polymerase alpha subunit